MAAVPGPMDQRRRAQVTAALDIAVVVTAACVVAASVGADDVFGRRWMALFFFVIGPGWAIQRRSGHLASAEHVFIAVGTSLATMAVVGHLTVTVLAWHWAPVMVLVATASGGAIALQRWRTDVVDGIPTLTWGRDHEQTDVGDDSTAHWLSPTVWWTAVVTGLVAGVLAVVGLAGSDERAIDGYGLVGTVPIVTWLGVAVSLVCLAAVLGSRPRDHAAMAALTAMIALILHGAPGLVETHPRFPVAWLHVGFIDQISTNGALLPDLDARFSWPGFFAGSALLDQAAGTAGTLWLVRFTPVVITLLGCLGIWTLGRLLGLGSVPTGAATTLFLVLDWAGQDYFSPQATAFVLYLTVIVLVLRWFAGPGPRAESRLGRLLRVPAAPAGAGDAIDEEATAIRWRVLAVVGLAGAMIITHQLTPGFLTVILLALGLAGLIRLRWLGVMVGLLTVAWLSFGGEAWWLGHLDTLTGSVGNVRSIVEDNVGQRTGGAAAARELVLRSRLGLSAGVWLVVGASLLRFWRGRPEPRVLFLAAMFATPFPLLVLQPYGGELLIRIYFFVLPAAVLVLGHTLFPDGAGPSVRRAVLAAVSVAVLPVLVLARYGNEQFETVTDDDLATVQVLLESAPTGADVFIVNGQALVNVDRVGELRYVSVSPPSATGIVRAIREADEASGYFVYLSRPQEVFGQQTVSRADGWLTQVGDDLVATGLFEVHRHDAGGTVLEYQP
ncbi:hypothetical protein [Actinospongicola halichondriae]|uniref:hypothetical protein n=1 Tax=Actinospongicola halichondriae TaxID=3236844 RepID=UPI003D569B21